MTYEDELPGVHDSTSEVAAPSTSAPQPTDTWTRITTVDALEAKHRTEEVLACSHTFTVIGRGRDQAFEARVAHSSLADVGIMTSVYGSAVEIVCRPPMPTVTVSLVSRGSIEFLDERGRTTATVVPGRGAAVAYDRAVRMTWAPGTEQVMLVIRKDAVETALASMLGDELDEPLRFDALVDSNGTGQAVVGLVGTLGRLLSVEHPPGGASVLARELERSIVTSLLTTQHHNYSGRLLVERSVMSSKTVRRVLNYMEQAQGTPVRMSDLVQVAGVSERTLHDTFNRQLGTSPMAYLRALRLESARADLLRHTSDPAVSVTDIALKWGFNHGGRFAAAYRKKFGESPSETLRP
ncbi:AraC family transcriptional regulator [Rhodococcus pyridinivorans]|uniref:AraC family transcriptional regulator n=1 Tax=Rhodococcus TaxID=1827 RepID=UPI001C7D26C4|nr:MULTISPECIES: helix-turn-helix domain-containing protein [Rhodococcus]MBX4171812.1 AraC family transcriptional regulator [Rhodococcus sp. DMU2021]MCD5422142.1 AraC family transcriptional regulator [Rhodococcus pyridinivorans]UTM36838.1 AraC family transcriptional regulator [Rhodococcus pyridinivorans]